MEKIPFGAATITIDPDGTEPIVFDGVEYGQADGGEVNLEPVLADIKYIDFGDANYDDYINGYEGTVKVVASANDIKIIKLHLGNATEIVDGTSEQEALVDSKVGTSMRDKGKKITIHPREMGSDKSLDINIYKATAVGAFTRTFNAEQGTQEIELKMYVRDGADPSKEGNYFYIGSSDPASWSA